MSRCHGTRVLTWSGRALPNTTDEGHASGCADLPATFRGTSKSRGDARATATYRIVGGCIGLLNGALCLRWNRLPMRTHHERSNRRDPQYEGSDAEGRPDRDPQALRADEEDGGRGCPVQGRRHFQRLASCRRIFAPSDDAPAVPTTLRATPRAPAPIVRGRTCQNGGRPRLSSCHRPSCRTNSRTDPWFVVAGWRGRRVY
jgi:hypothetical protein